MAVWDHPSPSLPSHQAIPMWQAQLHLQTRVYSCSFLLKYFSSASPTRPAQVPPLYSAFLDNLNCQVQVPAVHGIMT
jgi:hypothetical protein